ncbi:YdiY family protein [Paraferrimonas sp. SM1919]|uniref:DUF481 domain-containing protein n=1 Tax=Paraferrimonas sp. SM1919 TaxID=2662263 RepID=UPI001F08B8FA|nr:DUF481 domain-containing protein [Paraferrimonas sp. SM1919]
MPCAHAVVPTYYEEPFSPFSAEVEFGLQINTGNTATSSGNARTKMQYDTQDVRQEGEVRGYYSSNSEKTTTQQLQLRYQNDLKFDDGDYLLGRAEFSWDKFGSFTRQHTISIGYGFSTFNLGNKSKLKLEVGPGFRYNLPIESAENLNPTSNQEFIARTAVKYEQELHEYSTLEADLTAEVGTDNSILTGEISYKSMLFQDWALKVGIDTKYTAIVPVESKKFDTKTTINLLYRF